MFMHIYFLFSQLSTWLPIYIAAVRNTTPIMFAKDKFCNYENEILSKFRRFEKMEKRIASHAKDRIQALDLSDYQQKDFETLILLLKETKEPIQGASYVNCVHLAEYLDVKDESELANLILSILGYGYEKLNGDELGEVLDYIYKSIIAKRPQFIFLIIKQICSKCGINSKLEKSNIVLNHLHIEEHILNKINNATDTIFIYSSVIDKIVTLKDRPLSFRHFTNFNKKKKLRIFIFEVLKGMKKKKLALVRSQKMFSKYFFQKLADFMNDANIESIYLNFKRDTETYMSILADIPILTSNLQELNLTGHTITEKIMRSFIKFKNLKVLVLVACNLPSIACGSTYNTTNLYKRENNSGWSICLGDSENSQTVQYNSIDLPESLESLNVNGCFAEKIFAFKISRLFDAKLEIIFNCDIGVEWVRFLTGNSQVLSNIMNCKISDLQTLNFIMTSVDNLVQYQLENTPALLAECSDPQDLRKICARKLLSVILSESKNVRGWKISDFDNHKA